MYFCYFIIISPWKSAGPIMWTNLNPLHPRMLCAMFGWNWLRGFWIRRWKCEKFTDGRMDRQTDRRTDRRTEGQWTTDKLTWAFSSGELKTTKIKTNPFNVIVIKIQIPAFYSLITCTKPNSNCNCCWSIRETSWGVWRGTDDPPCRVCPSSGSRYKTSHWQGSAPPCWGRNL